MKKSNHFNCHCKGWKRNYIREIQRTYRIFFVGKPAGFVVEVWSGTSLPKTKERVEMKQVLGKVNVSALLYIDWRSKKACMAYYAPYSAVFQLSRQLWIQLPMCSNAVGSMICVRPAVLQICVWIFSSLCFPMGIQLQNQTSSAE